MSRWITGSLVVGSLIVFGLLLARQGASEKALTTDQVAKIVTQDTNIVILDVRTPGEFQSETGHLKGALLIPVQELENRVDELEFYRDKTIITYCRTQNRSSHAAALLREKGFKALHMVGGIAKWNAEERSVAMESR